MSSSPAVLGFWLALFIDVPFRAEPHTVSYSLHADHVWVSVLVATYCKKKLLW